MSIKSYVDTNNEKFYEVYVGVRTPNGGKRQLRKRGIKTLHAAKVAEFEMKRTLTNKREFQIYTWPEWHKIIVERIRLEFLPSTVQEYEGQLSKWVTPVWQYRKIHEIMAKDVHDLIFREVKDVAPNTRHNILKKLKRVFQMALDDGIIERNPALPIKVKVPEVKQAVLNATEVNKLLQEAKNLNHRFYEIWAVALFTGLRAGELYALKWNDVDFENSRIYVTRSWCSKNGYGPTKSSKNRVVPMSSQLESMLATLKLAKRPDYEFVLPHLEEWSRGEQAKVLREFCKEIGITSVKFHDLRATFITQLLLKGVALAQVMSMVGHCELKTTNEYLRIAGADLDGATEKLAFSLPLSEVAKVIDLIRK